MEIRGQAAPASGRKCSDSATLSSSPPLAHRRVAPVVGIAARRASARGCRVRLARRLGVGSRGSVARPSSAGSSGVAAPSGGCGLGRPRVRPPLGRRPPRAAGFLRRLRPPRVPRRVALLRRRRRRRSAVLVAVAAERRGPAAWITGPAGASSADSAPPASAASACGSRSASALAARRSRRPARRARRPSAAAAAGFASFGRRRSPPAGFFLRLRPPRVPRRVRFFGVAGAVAVLCRARPRRRRRPSRSASSSSVASSSTSPSSAVVLDRVLGVLDRLVGLLARRRALARASASRPRASAVIGGSPSSTPASELGVGDAVHDGGDPHPDLLADELRRAADADVDVRRPCRRRRARRAARPRRASARAPGPTSTGSARARASRACPWSSTRKWSRWTSVLADEEEAALRRLLELAQPRAAGADDSAATFAFTSTLNAFAREPGVTSARSLRSISTAAVRSETTIPSPPQVGHLRVITSRGPSVTFCRVISTRPSGEISTT